MKAIDIISVIEEFAPRNIQEEWDNSGLMAGDTQREVKSVLLGLDCTPELILEAIEIGADMIITHHPLIFKGIKKIGTETVQERMISSIIKKDIVVYSVHTNIDKVPLGVSALMAERIELRATKILMPQQDSETGLGIVGDLVDPMDFNPFIKMVKERFSLKVVRTSKPTENKISRVALCGGSGVSLIPAARASGAQIFITGDVSYHNYFCEDEFMIMDIGHYESEIDVLELLMSVILKKIPNFAVHISERNNNPIYYH
ncbi:MAG: Nif3-like dinuclear metal center hexameric protein [Bacteroidetes bacterium HGW-Bacteroidetes-8]|jgi:dinuclear metal center YbgI/SA1388 family protein|nr:MAG: Nif3-like dinuclear metal center hexameric protein [Bacteroidetes bacterium HGW-Bacteroidetes-8]